MSSLSSTLNHKTTPRISSRLPLAAGVIFVLWMAYTVTEALFQMNRLHPVTATILEFIPGLCGIGLLLLAGLSLQDCFLQRAPISKAGLAVLFLLTPLFIPVLLSATFAGWRPANALILNPLSAISQELFFRCALLPALLILLRGHPRWAVFLQAVLFGLWHTGPLVQGAILPAVLSVMIVPFLFGLGWGWQTRHDRTVIWAMIYHIILLFIGAFYTWTN